jgi:molecular chaperone GrpE
MTEERVEQTTEQEPPEQARPEPTAERVLEQRLLRALADLDNLRKRNAREMGRELARERSRLAAAWLPVIDGLDRAVHHGNGQDGGPDGGQGCAGLVEGVRALRDQAVTIMERLGYPRFEDIGRRFDPVRHEAVGVVADPDAEPMTLVGVVRPGYGTDEQVLRPASVLVAGGPEQAG